MGQRSRSNDAATMDAQIMLVKEECAGDMGKRSNDAAGKDAQIKLRKGECALGMGQRDYAAEKDVQTMSRKEECASGMGQSAILMNLLHSDQSSSRILHLNPNSINMLLNLPSRDEVEKASPERCQSSVKKYTKFSVAANKARGAAK